MRTRFVVMNFGEERSRFLQAHYCLLNLIAARESGDDILVVTDRPGAFSWFGKEIAIRHVNSEEMAQWVGPFGYFFRVLIRLILEAASDPSVDVVAYLDSDTIPRYGLRGLLADAHQGAVLLDRREYTLSRSRRRGNRQLWREIGGREFAGHRFMPEIGMWNTGITIIGRRMIPFVESALAVLDALLGAGCRHFLLEQAAMSVALERSSCLRAVNPPDAPPRIIHYWGNKDGYLREIAAVLAAIHAQGFDPAAAVRFVVDQPIHLREGVRVRWWHRLLGVRPA